MYTKDGAQVTIIFEGIRGKGYAGDIALDDITVKRGSCPAERTCYFYCIVIFLLRLFTSQPWKLMLALNNVFVNAL